MKKFTKLVCLVALAMFFTQFVSAQKFGHINSTQLLSFMPETKMADSTLRQFSEQLESTLKTMGLEYQAKMQEFKQLESSGSMSAPIRDAKIQEITDLEERIGKFQESAQQSLQTKKEEVYSPIIKKAEDAIQGVAKDGTYTYIFDTSIGVLLYAEDSKDIMSLVKTKLGIQ